MAKYQQPKPPKVKTPQEAILESISDGVFTVDKDWRVTSFNRAAEEITGISRQEAIGRLCSDVFRSSMCEAECALRKTLKNGKPIINTAGYIINADGQRIPISVSTAVLRNSDGTVAGGAETFRDLSDVEALRKELSGQFQIGDIVSHSPVMQRIFDLAPAVAASPSTVLIHGETGTGKELLARAIHNMSPRANKPFIAVNCAALPDTLLESELFGYKKGAFTGADRDKPGRFAMAKDGTLFLDEIGEISPALQVRLLRVLQENCYEPLGALESVSAQARIITATNRDLEAMVKSGTFRQDLFYRINVVSLTLPPLRQRKEDIPILVGHFIEKFNRLHNRNIQGVKPQVCPLLAAHDWPGNVRELENIIERAFVLCQENWITPRHLPEHMTGQPQAGNDNINMQSARQLTEKQLILSALRRHHYNRAAAARELGIHKTTFYRKIKSLDIALPQENGRSKKADQSTFTG